MKQNTEKKLKKILYIIFFVLLFSGWAFALSGKCNRILDGDTIEIVSAQGKTRIRLYGVDTPEKKQAYGKESRLFTISMVAGKTIEVQEKGFSYNRIVGIVYVGDVCLNMELLKAGFAWLAPGYCKESFCNSWKDIEHEAKNNSLGLWADPQPVSPWDYRHKNKKE